MAKCLVGANGGGKVTIEGLTADMVMSGKTVIIKQGAKELLDIVGKLDVLTYATAQNGPSAIYWNGSGYATYPLGGYGGSYNFAGTPLFAMAKNGLADTAGAFTSLSICGVNMTGIYTLTRIEPKNNTIAWGAGVGKNGGTWVVLGIKE